MVAANPENGNTMSYNLVNAKIAVKTALDYAAGGTQAGEYEMTDIPDDAVGFNGHYYYAYPANNAASWNLAAQYCADQNGYLATITSQEENDFLLSYIQQKGFDQEMCIRDRNMTSYAGVVVRLPFLGAEPLFYALKPAFAVRLSFL